MKKHGLEQKNKSTPSIVAARKFEIHTGPLPHPAILEEYNRIHPGAADRIIEMAEQESQHRRRLEKQALEAEIIEIRIGQIFAFLIGVVTILSGSYTAMQGAQIAGGFIGTAGVVGLVSVFIVGHRTKE